MDNKDLRIEQADTREKYEGLRDLWCRVFGDEPGYVDAMYEAFGDDIRGYVIRDDAGKTLSALTCYRCGHYSSDADASSLNGLEVYVSYAICTDPDYRGQGLAGRLVEYVKDMVTAGGAVSIVSPAERSLVKFYEGLGYSQHFFASEGTAYSQNTLLMDEYEPDIDDSLDIEVLSDAQIDAELRRLAVLFGDDDDEIEPFDPGISVLPVDASMYNIYREAFLTDIPHVSLTDKMLKFVRMDSLNSDGLLVINGGDAICTAEDTGEGLKIRELIINPMLTEYSTEIDEEIASRLADHLRASRLDYRTPGAGYCQTMIAAPAGVLDEDCRKEATDRSAELADNDDDFGRMEEVPPYYGFPIE